jgi:5-methylcytosine-specific restriction endonuclease McrA
MWNGIPLVLVLDHINGKNNDNRQNNLRLLCPNCNSQQSTFAGKNKKKMAPPLLSISEKDVDKSKKVC